MKSFLLISVFALTTSAFAAEEKVIAVTTDCPHKVQIKAKEGDKKVKAIFDGQEEHLVSKTGEAFSLNSPEPTTFVNPPNKSRHGLPAIKFHFPSVVESNLPKLEIANNGKSIQCNMKMIK